MNLDHIAVEVRWTREKKRSHIDAEGGYYLTCNNRFGCRQRIGMVLANEGGVGIALEPQWTPVTGTNLQTWRYSPRAVREERRRARRGDRNDVDVIGSRRRGFQFVGAPDIYKGKPANDDPIHDEYEFQCRCGLRQKAVMPKIRARYRELESTPS